MNSNFYPLSPPIRTTLSLILSLFISLNIYSAPIKRKDEVKGKRNFLLKMANEEGPFYSYSLLSLEDQKFEQKILPLMKSIVTIYFSTFKHFNTLQDHSTQLFVATLKLLTLFPDSPLRSYGLKKRYPLLLSKILSELSNIQTILLKMRSTPLLKFQNERGQLVSSPSLNLALEIPLIFDPQIDIENDLDDLLMATTTLFTKTLHFSLFYDHQYRTAGGEILLEGKDLNQLKESVRNLNFFGEKIFIRSIPLKVRTPFHFVWHHFFKEINLYSEGKLSKEHFLQNFEELNFSWNNFYQKISKESLTIPPSSLSNWRRVDDEFNAVVRFVIENENS